jgi:hypothetical protein
MSDRTDRKDYREDLGTLLSGELTGAGNPAQAFYDHLESYFDGASPTVCLASAGTLPVNETLGGKRYIHHINILVFVARDDANADDTLDNCFLAIADTVEANRKTADWKDLDFNGPSTVNEMVWGGDPYWVETIPVQVQGY